MPSNIQNEAYLTYENSIALLLLNIQLNTGNYLYELEHSLKL